MPSSYLGIDVGLSAVHAVLLDGAGDRLLARASSPLSDAPEQETDLWFEAMRDAIARLETPFGRDPVVGLAAQEGAYTFLDRDDVELLPTPLLDDRRCENEARELALAYGHAVRTSHLAARLLWWKRHRGEAFASTLRVLTARELIHYRLTGRRGAVLEEASTTGLYHRTRGLRRVEAEVVDGRAPSFLAGVAAADRLLPMRADAADFLGLPDTARVHPGSSDRLLAARAVGLAHPGPVMIRLGRGGCVIARHHEAAVDPDGWCDVSWCDDGSCWVRVVLPDLLAAVDEAAALVGDGGTHAIEQRVLRRGDRAADKTRAPLVLPSLEDAGLPGPGEERGAILGVARGDLKPDQLYQATLVGAALHCAWAVDVLRAAGVGATRIELAAPSLPPVFPTLVAAMAGLPARVHPGGRLAATGAAHLAAGRTVELGEGGLELPDAALARRYQADRERFRVEMRRRHRRKPSRSRRDPRPGTVQRLLSTDW